MASALALAPQTKKRQRQYAPEQAAAYSGVDAGGLTQQMDALSMDNTNSQPVAKLLFHEDLSPPYTHVDLLSYTPDPADLIITHPPLSPPLGSTISPATIDLARRYQTPTLSSVPVSDTVLKQTSLPLALTITPHPSIHNEELPLPLAAPDGVIARCQQCLAYINPYVRIVDFGTRWTCSLCGTANTIPAEFGFAGRPAAEVYASRVELTHTVVDFAATQDYSRAPPQAPAFVFLLDVSEAAIQNGLFALAAQTIADFLRLGADGLPNKQQRTRVAIMCYDSVLHFFKVTPETFGLLVVPDITETFLPLAHPDVLVNISQDGVRDTLLRLLAQLPSFFLPGRGEDKSATGVAIDAARELLASAGGGKIVLVAASAPHVGRGALEDSMKTEETKSAATFYHDLAAACVNGCVSVDLFLVGPRYTALPSLSLLPHYTGGLTMYYRDLGDKTKFSVELGRVLALPCFYEAEMRVRCSRGISVKAMYGDFFLQAFDRAVFASLPPDRGYAVELQIDGRLAGPLAVVQTALLHTTTDGQRAIRVITSALPVTHLAAEVLASADAGAVVGLIAKRAVQRRPIGSDDDLRDRVLDKVLENMCRAYAQEMRNGAEMQLRLPSNLRMLPTLLLSLYKKLSTQGRLASEQAFDLAGYIRATMSSASLKGLIQLIYPAVYALHTVDPETDLPTEPLALPLTSEWWEFHGVYLLHSGDGQRVYIWVGRDAVPQLVRDIFGPGVAGYAELLNGPAELPVLNTAVSRVARGIIARLREGINWPTMLVVKDEKAMHEWVEAQRMREEVVMLLVQDRVDAPRPGLRQVLVGVHERLRKA
ncbi:hypothetical protein MIND_00574000 [Mycena indigotica]|uniref:Uncharacterized protein n=1 Tax=Mycena indigotica TaxID=2126181 RepID=A0A8H6W3C0_9AGAR|nr:uncharacterized protein MIND_00574000 [Mycena indigotica]KAF7303452.1 hypothetical protein MIND_00574000 [Mycena indigotica]